MLSSIEHMIELIPSEFEAFNRRIRARILSSLHCDQAILNRWNHFELLDGGDEPWQGENGSWITLHCEIEACLTNADLFVLV